MQNQKIQLKPDFGLKMNEISDLVGFVVTSFSSMYANVLYMYSSVVFMTCHCAESHFFWEF